MAWPKGKPRKAPAPVTSPAMLPEPEPEIIAPEAPEYPSDWHPGMLLNVRNTGPDYTITLWPEEADPRKPERALHFTNPGEAQNWISRWYSRQSHDPRAR